MDEKKGHKDLIKKFVDDMNKLGFKAIMFVGVSDTEIEGIVDGPYKDLTEALLILHQKTPEEVQKAAATFKIKELGQKYGVDINEILDRIGEHITKSKSGSKKSVVN